MRVAGFRFRPDFSLVFFGMAGVWQRLRPSARARKFKPYHYPDFRFLDTPEKGMLNFLSLRMRQKALCEGAL